MKKTILQVAASMVLATYLFDMLDVPLPLFTKWDALNMPIVELFLADAASISIKYIAFVNGSEHGWALHLGSAVSVGCALALALDQIISKKTHAEYVIQACLYLIGECLLLITGAAIATFYDFGYSKEPLTALLAAAIACAAFLTFLHASRYAKARSSESS